MLTREKVGAWPHQRRITDQPRLGETARVQSVRLADAFRLGLAVAARERDLDAVGRARRARRWSRDIGRGF